MRQTLLHANTQVANPKIVRLDAPRISMQNKSFNGFSNQNPQVLCPYSDSPSLSFDPFLSQYQDALYTLLATILNQTRGDLEECDRTP